MAEKEPDRGPSFTWTFPLVRRFQSRNGILSLGAKIIERNRLSSNDNSEQSTSNNSSSVSSGSENTESQDSVLDDIEDSIQDLTDGDTDFSQDGEGQTHTIDITNDGFDPQELNIDTGDTVKWVNESDTQSKITSVNNDKIRSDMLDPGDEHEETLYGNVVTEFRDSLADDDSTGSVTVGDPDEELDVNPVPLDENSDSGTRSMSQAATDKTDRDIGF